MALATVVGTVVAGDDARKARGWRLEKGYIELFLLAKCDMAR
jgi:hypothetical protein